MKNVFLLMIGAMMGGAAIHYYEGLAREKKLAIVFPRQHLETLHHVTEELMKYPELHQVTLEGGVNTKANAACTVDECAIGFAETLKP